MNEFQLEQMVSGLVVLLIVAAVTLGLCKKLKLPFTIMLVLVGMLLAWLSEHYPHFLGILSHYELTPDLVLYVFLPTLVFESALSLDIRHLQRNLIPILTLAIPGLLLSTAVIGVVVWVTTPLNLSTALLLGAILSATDPVAVISLFKQLGLPKRLTILVEGESLLNDATALVLARLLVGIIVAGSFTIDTIVFGMVDFFVVFFGGIIVGWITAMVVSWFIGVVEGDYFIEVTLTTVLAYCSFLIAEELLHVSGIMATVSAGIVMAALGQAKISPTTVEYMKHFWEYMAFLANAFIFLLVGLQIDLIALWNEWDILVWVVIAMLSSRFLVIYGLVPLVGKIPGTEPVGRAYQTVMFWGGLRGAIALAIVLSLPDFNHSDLLEILVMGAVLFTLIVQGLSIELLISFLRLNRPPLADRLAQEEGILRAQQHLMNEIPALEKAIHFSPRVAKHMREDCNRKINTVTNDINALRQGLDEGDEFHLLLMRCFAKEKSCYYQQFCYGHLTEHAFRELDHLVTAQINSLRFFNRVPKDSFGRFSSKRIHRFLVRWFSKVRFFSKLVQHMRTTRMTLDYDIAWGRVQAGAMVLESLGEIAKGLSVSDDITERGRQLFQGWHQGATNLLGEMADQFPEFVDVMQERLGERVAALAGITTIEALAHDGTYPEAAADQLVAHYQHQLTQLRGPVGSALSVSTVALLRKIPILHDLPDHEFCELIKKLSPHTVPRHEMLIYHGETSASLFFVARGAVAVSDANKKIDKIVYHAGAFFGGSDFVRNSSLGAQAIIPSSIYELREKDLNSLCEEHPSFLTKLKQTHNNN